MAYTSFSTSNYIFRLSTPITTVPFSISAWVYVTNDSLNNGIVTLNSSTGIESAGISAEGNIANDPVNAYIVDNEGTTHTRSSSSFEINKWIHVCGVFSSSSNRTIYLNGVSSGTTTTTKNPVAFTLINIGVWKQGGNTTAYDPLNGRVSQVCIYNKALSDSEINSLAKGFSGRLVAPQNLKVFIPLTRGFSDYMGVSFSQQGTVSVIENPRVYA